MSVLITRFCTGSVIRKNPVATNCSASAYSNNQNGIFSADYYYFNFNNMYNKNSQFKTLIQHELLRLQNIVASNEALGVYPVDHRYANTFRSGKIRQSQKHRWFSTRALRLISF
jgi:hypothetical protein